MIRAIFFDFDGTVSDAKSIAVSCFMRTLDELGYRYDKKNLIGLLGIKTERILRKLGLEGENVEKVRKKFYGYFTEAALNGGIRPCVSLKPLWKMKDEGIPLIVVSNSRGSFLRASIKQLKLEGLFEGVYGAEKFESKDLGLRDLFKKMKISPNEAIYVGDRFSDIDFARKAGCVSVAIQNKRSWSTLERIKKEKPDYIIRDFYGLRKILRELNRN